MKTDELTNALPPGFTARFWSGEKYDKEDRIYINHGKYGEAGNYLLFRDGTYFALGFDNSMGETKEIHRTFREWWEEEQEAK